MAQNQRCICKYFNNASIFTKNEVLVEFKTSFNREETKIKSIDTLLSDQHFAKKKKTM